MPNYLPSLNYLGSSGYSVYGDLNTGPTYPAGVSGSARTDYAVLRPDGTYVSILTGQPYTGTDPHSGQKISGGKLVTGGAGTVQVPGTENFINPNDPSQRYKPVSITKQPDVAAGQQDLMKTFTDTAASALKDFNQYLSSFKQGTGQAFQAGQQASNVAPTVGALQGAQQQYAGQLGATQQQYGNLLAQNAAAEQGIVGQAQAILPQYDTAAQAIGDRQLAAMIAQQARYKMGSGTPTSLGGADAAILARAVADVNLPLQEQKIGRQYGLLQNLALPVQQDITNRGTQFYGQFNPAIANQIYGSAQGTAQQIQALKQIASQFGYQNALQYMQSIQVPAQIQQQVLSGQIGQLGQLSGLENMANYTGLQDVLGYGLSQPIGYSGAGGAYPRQGPRYPQTAPLPTGGGGGAPVQVQPPGLPVFQGAGGVGYPAPSGTGYNAYTDQATYWPGYGGLPTQQPQVYAGAPTYTGDVNLPAETYG